MVATVEEVSGVAPVNLSESGSWLCSRHPDVRELVQSIYAWSEELEAPNMHALRDMLITHDQLRRRNADAPWYQPHEGPLLRLWMMTPSQIGRLRLLATLAPDGVVGSGVEWSVYTLCGFDAAGREFIEDWLRAVRIGVLG